MARPVLLCLFMLLAVVPAPSAEIRLVDSTTGSGRTLVRGEAVLERWTDDGAAVLISRRAGGTRRVGVDGSVTRVPALDGVESIGPGGRSLRRPPHSSEAAAVELRAPDGRVVGSYRLGFAFSTAAIAWSRDGTRVALAMPEDLLVLDTASGDTLLRDRRLERPRVGGQAFAPDASALVVEDGQAIMRVAVPSGETSVLATAPDRCYEPGAAWGAAGRIVIRVCDRARIIGDSSGEVSLKLKGLSSAFWTRDGARLTYAFDTATDKCAPGREGVGLALPGEAPRVLLKPSYRSLGGLAWSPDGATLAVELGPDDAQHRRPGDAPRWPKHIARDYGMFTRRGDAAMRKVVLRAARMLRRGAAREETMRRVRAGVNRIGARFSGTHDTDVSEQVAEELDGWLRAAGLELIDATEEISC